MQKETYYYNPNTLKYEKIKLTLGQRIWRISGFVATSFFFALLIITIGYTFITPPSQRGMDETVRELENNYLLLDKRIDALTGVMSELEDRDNNVYRVIFESDGLPDELRKGGFLKAQRFKELSASSKRELITSTSQKLKELERRVYVQSKSYDQIMELVKNKEAILECTPAIQPVSNKQLKRIASGFGMRIDPVYKTPKMHAGLDFTAPIGTEIYATGDGIVRESGGAGDGYGNKIVIDHGYGYQTLYGHCSKVLVKRGQKVKRGEKIGLVGSTGKSTGPHLHYEVIRKGIKIDPINFFYNDLTPEEYDKLLKLAREKNQSFD